MNMRLLFVCFIAATSLTACGAQSGSPNSSLTATANGNTTAGSTVADANTGSAPCLPGATGSGNVPGQGTVQQPSTPVRHLVPPFTEDSLNYVSELAYTFYQLVPQCSSPSCDGNAVVAHVVMTNDANYCAHVATGKLPASSAVFDTSETTIYYGPFPRPFSASVPVSGDQPSTLFGTDANGQLSSSTTTGDFTFSAIIPNAQTMQDLNYRAQYIFGTDRVYKYGSVAAPQECNTLDGDPTPLVLPYAFFAATPVTCDPNNPAYFCSGPQGGNVTPISYQVHVALSDDPNFCSTVTSADGANTTGHFVILNNNAYHGVCHTPTGCEQLVVPVGTSNVPVEADAYQISSNMGLGNGYFGVTIQDANTLNVTDYKLLLELSNTPLHVHVAGGATAATRCDKLANY